MPKVSYEDQTFPFLINWWLSLYCPLGTLLYRMPTFKISPKCIQSFKNTNSLAHFLGDFHSRITHFLLIFFIFLKCRLGHQEFALQCFNWRGNTTGKLKKKKSGIQNRFLSARLGLKSGERE